MIRLALRAILVLAPIVLALLWLRYSHRSQGLGEEAARAALTRMTREMTLAVVAMVALSMVCFAVLRLQENSAPPSKSYVPAGLEDGRIVPGHFR